MTRGVCDKHGRGVPFIRAGKYGVHICQACVYERETGKQVAAVKS